MSDFNSSHSAATMPLAPQSLLSLGRRQNSLGATGADSPRKAIGQSMGFQAPLLNQSALNASSLERQSSSGSLTGASINQSNPQSNAWSSLQDREPPSAGQRRWVDYGNNERPVNAWKRGNERSRFERDGQTASDDRPVTQSNNNQSFTSMAPMTRSRSDHSDETSGSSRFARFDRERQGSETGRSGFERGNPRYDNDRSNNYQNQSSLEGGRFDRAYTDRDRVTDWGDRAMERTAPKRDFRGNYQSNINNQSTGRFADQDASYDEADRTSPAQGPMHAPTQLSTPHSRQTSNAGLPPTPSNAQSDAYTLGAADIARLNTKFGPSSHGPYTYSRDFLLSLYRPCSSPPHDLVEVLEPRGMLFRSPQPPHLASPLTEAEVSAKAAGAWFLPHRSYHSQQPRRTLPGPTAPRRQMSAGSLDGRGDTRDRMPAWADTPVSSILGADSDLNAIHEQSAAIETERLSMRRAAEWSEAQAVSHANAAALALQPPVLSNPPPSLGTVRWFYKDPQGETQGPFTGADMKEWYEKGYFDLDLPIQCTPASNPNPPTQFATLGTWFNQGRPAFLDAVPALPMHSSQQTIQPPINQSLNQSMDNQHDSILRRGALGLGPSWGNDHEDRLNQSINRSLRIDDEHDDHRFGGPSANQSLNQSSQHQHWNSSFNTQPNQSLNQWQQFSSPSHQTHSGFLNMQSPSATKSLHFGSLNNQSINQSVNPPLSSPYGVQHDPWLHSAAMPNSVQQIQFGSHGPPSPVIHAQQIAMEQQQMMQQRHQQQQQQQQQQHFSQQQQQSINQQRMPQQQPQQNEHVMNQSLNQPTNPQYNQQQAAALARERMMQSNSASVSSLNQSATNPLSSAFGSFNKREATQSNASSPLTFSPVNQSINHSTNQTNVVNVPSPKPASLSVNQSPAPVVPAVVAAVRSPVAVSQPAASPVSQSSNQAAARWAPPAAKTLSLAEIQSLELEESRRRAAAEAQRLSEESAQQALVDQSNSQPAWGKSAAPVRSTHQSKPSLSEIMNEESRSEPAPVVSQKIEQSNNQANKELKKKVSVPMPAAPVKPASAWGAKATVAPKAVDLRSIQEQEEAERLRAEEQSAARLREQQAAASLASSNPGSVWGSLHPLVAQSTQKPPMSLKDIQAMESAAHANAPVSTGVKSAAALVSTPAWSSALSASKPSPTASSKTESIWDQPSAPSPSSDSSFQATALRSKSKAKAAAPVVPASSTSQQSNNAQTSAFGVSVHMSDELATWCRRELQSLTGSNDLTLVQYLLTLESDELIEETIIAYFGASDAVKKFARSFCQLSQFDREQTQGSTSSASAYSTSEKAKDTTGVKKSASAARRKRAGGK